MWGYEDEFFELCEILKIYPGELFDIIYNSSVSWFDKLTNEVK